MDKQKVEDKIKKAIKDEDIKTLEEIISNGFDINGRLEHYSSENIFTYAVGINKLEVVRWALKNDKIDVNYPGCWSNKYPIMHAIWNKRVELIKLLLSHPRIELNRLVCEGDESKYSILMIAIRNSTLEILQLLISHPKINVNFSNYDRFTPLMMASKEDYPKAVKLLLSHPKINVNIADHNGNTALIFASKYHNSEVVRELLSHPMIDISIMNYQCQDALYFAQNTKFQKIIEEKLSEPLNYNLLINYNNKELLREIYLNQLDDHSEAFAYMCFRKKWDLVSRIIENKREKTSYFLGKSAQEWCFLYRNFELGNRCISQTEDSHTVIDSIRESCKKYFGNDLMVNK